MGRGSFGIVKLNVNSKRRKNFREERRVRKFFVFFLWVEFNFVFKRDIELF